MDVVAAIPVKPFDSAKARLASVVDGPGRTQISEEYAARTAAVARDAGAVPMIVTRDDTVMRWAAAHDIAVIAERPELGRGLNGAARAAVAHAAAHGTAWAVIHADLPIVAPNDLIAMFEAAGEGIALAPSYDGGTNVIAGSFDSFPFSYGPGSFHRHLATTPRATVISRPGLALDLDAPRDLQRLARLTRKKQHTP